MDTNYENARKRVKAKKEFYRHLTSYVVMSIFFFLLNAVTDWGAWWFYWPMMGWGIGILFHYFDVFGLPGIDDDNGEWEERAIQEEMKRLERTNRPSSDELDREEPLDLKELEKQKRPWQEDDLV